VIVDRGALAGDGEVQSPVTGRVGLAWRIEVRYPGDRGGAIALVEQACTALRIGSHTIAEPHITGRTEAVAVDDARVRRYLSSRGVDPDDALEIRELVLLRGDTVELCVDRLGGPAVLRPAA
jgi:hypothetical protein